MTIHIIAGAFLAICFGIIIGEIAADSSVECRRPAIHSVVFVER